MSKAKVTQSNALRCETKLLYVQPSHTFEWCDQPYTKLKEDFVDSEGDLFNVYGFRSGGVHYLDPQTPVRLIDVDVDWRFALPPKPAEAEEESTNG